jgi:hypothetical protein
MLVIALGLAVIGLAALVTAVVTSNELIAWACIAASVLGVVLLIVDALRERRRGGAGPADEDVEATDAEADDDEPADYPAEASEEGSKEDSKEDVPVAPTDSDTDADADAADSDSADHNIR